MYLSLALNFEAPPQSNRSSNLNGQIDVKEWREYDL